LTSGAMEGEASSPCWCQLV